MGEIILTIFPKSYIQGMEFSDINDILNHSALILQQRDRISVALKSPRWKGKSRPPTTSS